MSDELPQCRAIDECRAYDGKRVQLFGVYTPWSPANPKAFDPERQAVRIQLGADLGPFLEPFWNPGAARSADEIARLSGKVVRVVGVFRANMPSDPSESSGVAAAIGSPCIQNVESIDSVDTAGAAEKV
ncbi:MAG TPA: hypothetical protein VGN90_14990 [Pyrinomonadaceae bacterium]|nr:hypothetical protein [Pyrinomonadaceae bacterium]